MNSFGNLFKITTWGESHGEAVGVVIDGCPAGLQLNEKEITSYLQENDRPIVELATERNEPNVARILSGVYKDRTIGTPISILIKNCDVKKGDYNSISEVFRPGHGDFTYHQKYDIPVLSGGGRASGRECITRIAAGYIAEKIIAHYLKDFAISTEIESLAGLMINDGKSRSLAVKKCLEIAENGDSTGGTIRITVSGIPSGIGEPVFHGINSTIAQGLMSIKTIKSIEIGSGRSCSEMSGSEFNDEFCITGEKIGFANNNCGGILSGITNGNDIIVRISVKPTPSIKIKKDFATMDNKIRKMSVNGRHDKNITPRIGPIAKAMISVVLLNYLMIAGIIPRDRMK
jgi:chorismate synthase